MLSKYWKLLLRLITGQKPKFVFTFFINGFKIAGINMQTTLKTKQFIGGQITPKDGQGKLATVEAGSVEYSSSNEAVATVEEDPDDETKFIIRSHGAGNAQINAKGDADLGEGVETITSFIDVTVEERKAESFEFTLGEPQDEEA